MNSASRLFAAALATVVAGPLVAQTHSVFTPPYTWAYVDAAQGQAPFDFAAMASCAMADTASAPTGTSSSSAMCGASGVVTGVNGNSWNVGSFTAMATGQSRVGSIDAEASLSGSVGGVVSVRGSGAFNQILTLTDPFNISRFVVESRVSGSASGGTTDDYPTAVSYAQLFLVGTDEDGFLTFDWESVGDGYLDGEAVLTAGVNVAEAPTFGHRYAIHSFGAVFLSALGLNAPTDADLFGTVHMGLATVRVYDLQGNERFDGFTLTGPAVSTVPEPGTIALLATGLAGVAAARRRRKSAAKNS